MESDRIEFIRSEYFDQDEIDELLSKRWNLGFYFRYFMLWICAKHKIFPGFFITLDKINKIAENWIVTNLFELLKLILIKHSSKHIFG